MGTKAVKKHNISCTLKTPSLKYIELENAFESSIKKFCSRISDSHLIYTPSKLEELEVNKETLKVYINRISVAYVFISSCLRILQIILNTSDPSRHNNEH